MTRTEAAYNEGVRAVLDMARTAAVTIEVRPDAQDTRQQAAAAALHGLAEGARVLLIGGPVHADPILEASRLIADEPAGSGGTIPCPSCGGSLRWGKDSGNGHSWGRFEPTGCLCWIA